MDDYFEIYEFRFVDRKTHARAVVYAREEETALEIIDKWNSLQNIFNWVKRKHRFKKRFYTSIPPYELEQEQGRYIEQNDKKFNAYKVLEKPIF